MSTKLISAILLFSIIYIKNAYSFVNNTYLQGGLGISYLKIDKIHDDKDDSEEDLDEQDTIYGSSIHSKFGYRFLNHDISIYSYNINAKIKKLSFETGDTAVSGSGRMQSSLFGIMYKYISKYNLNNFHLYGGLGTNIAIHTMKLDNFKVINGDFESDYKVIYNSYGLTAVIGAEEILEFKSMHPVYIELSYHYMVPYKVKIVDSTDEFNAELLTKSTIKDYDSHAFMLSIGMTIF